jgi:hypothetical protein
MEISTRDSTRGYDVSPALIYGFVFVSCPPRISLKLSESMPTLMALRLELNPLWRSACYTSALVAPPSLTPELTEPGGFYWGLIGPACVAGKPR